MSPGSTANRVQNRSWAFGPGTSYWSKWSSVGLSGCAALAGPARKVRTLRLSMGLKPGCGPSWQCGTMPPAMPGPGVSACTATAGRAGLDGRVRAP